MNILVAAEQAAGVRLFSGLKERPHRIIAVLTTESPTMGAGISPADVAADAGIPVWPGERVTDPAFASTVVENEVDLLLNMHSLHVVPGPVVEAPRIGSFNMHPSLLPRYAGLNSVSWALLNGESEHGVTLHWMVDRIDAGPIAYQEIVPIKPDDTALTLGARCTNAGVRLMLRLVDAATANQGGIPAVEQDLALRRYHGPEVPYGGSLSWDWSASQIVRFVRACDYIPLRSPWGHPRTHLEGREIGIAKARVTGEPATAPPGTVGPAEGGSMRVAAGDEWISVSSVHVDGAYAHASDVLHAGRKLDDG